MDQIISINEKNKTVASATIAKYMVFWKSIVLFGLFRDNKQPSQGINF